MKRTTIFLLPLLVACEVQMGSRGTISTWSGSSVPAPVPPPATAPTAASPHPPPATTVAPPPPATVRPVAAVTPAPAQTATPTPTPTATSSAAQTVSMIRGQSTFGNDQAVPGSLRGILYTIPEGTVRMPDLNKLAPIGYLYTTSLNIPSRSFDDGFPGIAAKTDWFALRYEGFFIVSKADTFTFTLASDDGSALYIDEKRVIENDGAHTIRSMVADVPLTAGQHTVRVDYWQGAKGPVALQLYVQTASLSQRPWAAAL